MARDKSNQPAIDLKALTTPQLTALLNSTPMGVVAKENQVRRIRQAGGAAFVGKTTALMAYVALCGVIAFDGEEHLTARTVLDACEGRGLPRNDDGTFELLSFAAWSHREAVTKL